MGIFTETFPDLLKCCGSIWKGATLCDRPHLQEAMWAFHSLQPSALPMGHREIVSNQVEMGMLEADSSKQPTCWLYLPLVRSYLTVLLVTLVGEQLYMGA